jgi:hypothetical protein
MREYDEYDDDSIRLYTPVLQRVIILAAVVIAVPVLMWTITTFVRSYVARPKAPLVEHVASTNGPTRIPLLAAPPRPAPVVVDPSVAPRGDDAASEANPTGEIGRGTLDAASLPDTNPSPSGATDSSATSAQTTPTPSPAAPAAAATGDATTGSNPTAAAPASAPRQAPRASDSVASTGPTSSDRGIAWPNPNATSAPDFAGPRLAPSAPPPAMRTATTEILPAEEPLRGPVPLPRHRPGIFAMAATIAANTPSGGGPVPLPRARPGDAPADTGTIVETPTSGRSELENAH